MKTFTTTELRRDSPLIFNAVQKCGVVAIAHRDRPMMVLMTQKELDRIKREK